MRHVYIRGFLALVWLAAAIISGISGNIPTAGLYILLGVVFFYSAFQTWKREKADKGERQA